MDVLQEAVVIMYSSAKLFIQERINACEEIGRNCDDYKRNLEIIEKAWNEHLNNVGKQFPDKRK